MSSKVSFLLALFFFAVVFCNGQSAIAKKELHDYQIDSCKQVIEVYFRWGMHLEGLQLVGKGGKRYPFRGKQNGKRSYVYLGFKEQIVAISGTHSLVDGKYQINTLQLHTNKKNSKVMGAVKGEAYFKKEVPEGHDLLGIATKVRLNGLEDIQLITSPRSEIDLLNKINTPTLIRPINKELLFLKCKEKPYPSRWKFIWNPVEGAEKYEFLVFLDTQDQVIIQAEIHNSYFWLKNNLGEVFKKEGWHWCVRAFTDNKWSSWSEIRSFAVDSTTTTCLDK